MKLSELDILEERTISTALSRYTIKSKQYKEALEALKRLVSKYPKKSPYYLASEIQRLSGDVVDSHELSAMWDRYSETNTSHQTVT